MSGVDLFRARDGALRDAMAANDRARELGREAARSAARYRRLKALRALELRDGGMAASLISDAVYADAEVNDARTASECAQADYRTEQEAVNLHKRAVDIHREDIAREWARAGGDA